MKTILVDAYNTFLYEEGGINQDMLTLLESYNNQKIILTSANNEQVKIFGLDKVPYKYFTLKHNPEKQDPAYYKIMLLELGLKKEDVIYFEHNSDAVISAKSVGINTLHYNKNRKDMEKLKNFIDNNI